MIKSSVISLQAECLNESVNVSSLIRKAYVIAKKLHQSDMAALFESELEGYKKGVPGYRTINGEIKCFNPYNGWIPVFFESVESHKIFRVMHVHQGVESLEKLITSSDAGTLISHFPPETEEILLRSSSLRFKPALHVSKFQLSEILNSVKKIILDWSLDLEARGIRGENLLFTDEERQMASQHSSINITNFSGVLGDVSGGAVSINTSIRVEKGNIESLRQHLTEGRIPEEDFLKLEKILSETENADDQKISKWVGEMTVKAILGTWEFAKEKAVDYLTKSINAYYGLP